MDEPTLQLVEEVFASQGASMHTRPISHVLLPRLDRAKTLDEVEAVIHEVVVKLDAVSASLTAVERGHASSALENALPQMLATQEQLVSIVESAVSGVAARKALVAQETLRRLLQETVQRLRTIAPASLEKDPGDASSAVMPASNYLTSVGVRLALLVIAIEHLVRQGSPLLGAIASKAYETSQTLRRGMADAGIDLTPWLDAPAETRTKRIVDAAAFFWSSLNTEQRRAVDEVWGERVEFPSRWPPPSS